MARNDWLLDYQRRLVQMQLKSMSSDTRDVERHGRGMGRINQHQMDEVMNNRS